MLTTLTTSVTSTTVVLTTTITPTTRTAWPSAPLLPDKVTFMAKSVRIGEKENMTIPIIRVNKSFDKSGRTLLAWLELMVISSFMPIDFMWIT